MWWQTTLIKSRQVFSKDRTPWTLVKCQTGRDKVNGKDKDRKGRHLLTLLHIACHRIPKEKRVRKMERHVFKILFKLATKHRHKQRAMTIQRQQTLL